MVIAWIARILSLLLTCKTSILGMNGLSYDSSTGIYCSSRTWLSKACHDVVSVMGIATFRIGFAPLSITNTSLVASMSTAIRRDADMMIDSASTSVEINQQRLHRIKSTADYDESCKLRLAFMSFLIVT